MNVRWWWGSALLCVLFPAMAAEPAPSYSPTPGDAFVAINDPDRFAWQLFCAISAPVGDHSSGTIMWERWPEQAEILADPDHAPLWPSEVSRPILRDGDSRDAARSSLERLSPERLS